MKTFGRVAEYCDGWMPILRPHSNPVEKIPALHERLRKAGGDPKAVKFVELGFPDMPAAVESGQVDAAWTSTAERCR